MTLWQAEQVFYQNGIRTICGIDEAGRGPLAGPVCAAAVVFPHGVEIEGVNDSKKLTEKRREELYELICEQAAAYGVAFATVEEIESLNILNAAMLAMKRAYEQLREKPGLVLIDGNTKRGFEHINVQCVIGGDATYASIAAASILAKVTRDRYMRQLALSYPDYGFEIHKGYATDKHRKAILEYGPCPEHRLSFLRNVLYAAVEAK